MPGRSENSTSAYFFVHFHLTDFDFRVYFNDLSFETLNLSLVRGQLQPHQETCQEHNGTEKEQRQRQFESQEIINGPEPICIPDHFAIKAAFHDHAVIDEAAVISLCPDSLKSSGLLDTAAF